MRSWYYQLLLRAVKHTVTQRITSLSPRKLTWLQAFRGSRPAGKATGIRAKSVDSVMNSPCVARAALALLLLLAGAGAPGGVSRAAAQSCSKAALAQFNDLTAVRRFVLSRRAQPSAWATRSRPRQQACSLRLRPRARGRLMRRAYKPHAPSHRCCLAAAPPSE